MSAQYFNAKENYFLQSREQKLKTNLPALLSLTRENAFWCMFGKMWASLPFLHLAICLLSRSDNGQLFLHLSKLSSSAANLQQAMFMVHCVVVVTAQAMTRALSNNSSAVGALCTASWFSSLYSQYSCSPKIQTQSLQFQSKEPAKMMGNISLKRVTKLTVDQNGSQTYSFVPSADSNCLE